ncbi:MAG: Gldg family protein [Myxococcales bacterium]|nr:Gldg family protein [Myxococcales bacterium]
MSQIVAIAKKELRGFFASPVAVLFLGGFLALALLGFFWQHKFFARGVADVRPLFEVLPLAMIMLVGALSMRLWAEEQRTGTIEILLTLPVPRHRLVLGKFIAGLALIALALAMTLGVPLTVAMLGDLDWGPVMGGYTAALLLAAAYLAIGMCISATTDNQLVALIGTVLVCLLLYVPGTEPVTQLVGLDAAAWLRSVATGSRFESISRGVLDARDLVYYLSLTAAFLALNVYMLVRRSFGTGEGDRRIRWQARLAVALALCNALLLNAWMAPITAARADLTARGDYSLSPTTKHIVRGLREPLLIRAYFSDNLPSELKTFVPRINDTLAEFQIASGDNITIERLDPTRSKALADRAKAEFGLESRPFRELSKNKDAVVSAYFFVVLKLGTHSLVLDATSFLEEKIIENKLTYRLKSVEYTVTGAIKKLAATGQNLGERVKALPVPPTITAYYSPDLLPPQFVQLPATLELAMRQLRQELGDGLTFAAVTPPPGVDAEAFFATHGVAPVFKQVESGKPAFFTLAVTSNGRTSRVMLDAAPTLYTLKDGIRSAIRRSIPGFSKVVGLWVPSAPPPPPAPDGKLPTPGVAAPPPPQAFETFGTALMQSDYDVALLRVATSTSLQLIDVLVLAGPSALSPAEVRAIDQYVMHGGSLIVLAGRYRLARGEGERISVERVNTGLEDMLRAWGIDVAPYLVLDEVADQFPSPTASGQLEMRPYPYFVRIDGRAMNEAHPATSDVAWSVMHYASPLVDAKTNGPLPARLGDIEVTPLLHSSPRAWTDTNVDVHPDRTRTATNATAALALKPPFVLGVSLTGTFTSHAAAQAKALGVADRGGDQLIAKSPPNTHVVVIGSSAFASDELVTLLTSLDNQSGYNNLLFLQNLVDWAVSDNDMLKIRANSTHTPLLNLADDATAFWEYLNYAIAAALLAAALLIAWLRRRAVRPWPIAAWRKAGES